MAGANIVDAQIFTTTDGRALDTIALSREFDHDEDEGRRANRIADSIEKALHGEIKLPEVVAQRAAAKGRLRAFALEPDGHHQQPVVEPLHHGRGDRARPAGLAVSN